MRPVPFYRVVPLVAAAGRCRLPRPAITYHHLPLPAGVLAVASLTLPLDPAETCRNAEYLISQKMAVG